MDDFKIPTLPTSKPIPSTPAVKTKEEKDHDIEMEMSAEEKLIENELWEPKSHQESKSHQEPKSLQEPKSHQDQKLNQQPKSHHETKSHQEPKLDHKVKSDEESKLHQKPKLHQESESHKEPKLQKDAEIEIQKDTQVDCKYKEPKWSEKPEYEYKFEVLKSGQIVDEISNLESRAYWVFGRLPDNHITMAHPTISRYHAVLQHRPKSIYAEGHEPAKGSITIDEGWYVFDLGSTHGTFINKIRCPPNTYCPIKVGHMLKLGGSTRNFILQGPAFDEEPESELSVTQLKELRKEKVEKECMRMEMEEEMKEKEGINWGMSEDADEETDLSINPYAITNNEELFLDDPKKTLRGFFEREGLDLEYKCDEMSPGTFVCRIELPIDDTNGKPIIAEICHKGKKKECVVQCALEACRILDRHGILRQSHHEPLKRKLKSDSDDDDDFLDRTGDIERKKLRKAAIGKNVALTYEDLLKQEDEINDKIKTTEENILKYQEKTKQMKERKKKADDDLDNFMDNLAEASVSMDKIEIRKLRVEQQRLKLEYQNIQKLLKIAKPLDLSNIGSITSNKKSVNQKQKLQLPLFGKRNKFKFAAVLNTEVKPVKKIENKSDEEEVELDEDGLESNNKSNTNLNSNTNKVESPLVIQNEPIEQKNDLVPETTLTNDEHKIEKISEWVSEEAAQEECKLINKSLEIVVPDESSSNDDSIKKKQQRVRVRNRNRRENIDIDDFTEFEDSDKHAEWVPPENQKGDGMTKLNEKFGY